jgi:two-component system, cell cycle response regulator
MVRIVQGPLTAPRPAKARNREAGMKLNVLLVDDDQAIRKVICRTLPDWGYNAYEAANGSEALDKLKQMAESEDRPHIVLLDWHMPDLDGIDLCKWIKTSREYKAGPHLYVLFFTVSDGTENETMAFQAGADGYIVKGSWESLHARLNAVKSRIIEEIELRKTITTLQKDPSGVLVKREIIDRLGRGAGDMTQSPMGIIMVDIDDFKKINDTYGHLIGDQILEAVGRRLHESVRSGNVGRYGGDEFLIGLPGCDTETAEKRAREIMMRLTADPLSTSSGLIRISISYGIAASVDCISLDRLIEIADQALYRQKQAKKQQPAIG